MLNSSYKIRSKKLKELGYQNYAAYLASEHWKKRRADFEAAFEPFCQYCVHPAQELHHKTYANLGAELDSDLEWVCHDHHAEVQKWGRVQPASEEQKRILREHQYADSFISTVTMWVAFKLIESLGRGEVRSPRDLL